MIAITRGARSKTARTRVCAHDVNDTVRICYYSACGPWTWGHPRSASVLVDHRAPSSRVSDRLERLSETHAGLAHHSRFRPISLYYSPSWLLEICSSQAD